MGRTSRMSDGCPCCRPGSYCEGLCTEELAASYVITLSGVGNTAPPSADCDCPPLDGDYAVDRGECTSTLGSCDAALLITPKTTPPVTYPDPCEPVIGCCWNSGNLSGCGGVGGVLLEIYEDTDCYVWVAVSVSFPTLPGDGNALTLKKRLDIPASSCRTQINGLTLDIPTADYSEYCPAVCDWSGASVTINEA